MRGLKTLVLAAMMVAVTAAGAQAKRKHKEEAPPVPTQQAPAKPAIPDIADRAKEFKDLDADAVRARLGQPRFLRKETPAQVWQYTDGRCVLLLVLYDPKSGSGPARVQYASGRALPGHEAESRTCLTGPPSTTPPNTTALPGTGPGTAGGRFTTAPALSGTPVYSPGDPPPPAK